MRLERQKPIWLTGVIKFQFHKGAIRTLRKISQKALSMIFQFHKGAIRTEYFMFLPLNLISFQFHKGAIRTLHLR